MPCVLGQLLFSHAVVLVHRTVDEHRFQDTLLSSKQGVFDLEMVRNTALY